MVRALRADASMSARGRIWARDAAGREWNVRVEWVRSPGPTDQRNLLEVRNLPDGAPEVSEWRTEPGGALTGWTWLPERRRFLKLLGIQGTDAFPGTVFRYEDLTFVFPDGRRAGQVRELEEEGRRLVLVESAPYHDYTRVQTFLDPETALPLRVVFYDRADFPFREQHYESVKDVAGRPFPTVLRARDVLTGARSVLTFEEVHFDLPVADSLFDLDWLETRLRRGMDPLTLPEPPPAASR